MNLKILFMILIYYTVLSLLFVFGAESLTDQGFTSNIDIDDSQLGEDEQTTGGLFGSGISFGRFAGFVAFGIGLPEDTPSWFSIGFIAWQSIITVMSVAFFISSLWDG